MRLYRFDKNKRETELSLTYIRNNCRLNQVRPVIHAACRSIFGASFIMQAPLHAHYRNL